MKSLFFVLLVALAATACSRKCVKTGKVKTVGQCAYYSYGKYGGDSTCVALTEDGTRVQSDNPYVAGETVCEQYE